MTEIAKNKKKGGGNGGSGGHLDTTNFMRQFRDSDSLELKKLSAAQFMEVWEHYDSDGKQYSIVLAKLCPPSPPSNHQHQIVSTHVHCFWACLYIL